MQTLYRAAASLTWSKVPVPTLGVTVPCSALAATVKPSFGSVEPEIDRLPATIMRVYHPMDG